METLAVTVHKASKSNISLYKYGGHRQGRQRKGIIMQCIMAVLPYNCKQHFSLYIFIRDPGPDHPFRRRSELECSPWIAVQATLYISWSKQLMRSVSNYTSGSASSTNRTFFLFPFWFFRWHQQHSVT